MSSNPNKPAIFADDMTDEREAAVSADEKRLILRLIAC